MRPVNRYFGVSIRPVYQQDNERAFARRNKIDRAVPDIFGVEIALGEGNLIVMHSAGNLPRLFQPVITEDFRIAANSLGVR
jgi:hypothetical protein